MLANGVKETTATTGTGTVTLAEVTGFARFSEAFSVGATVSYAIKDGNNWEWGIGTFGASNTLARTTITSTLVAGTYTTSGATAINLSGSAEVFCGLHTGNLGVSTNASIPSKGDILGKHIVCIPAGAMKPRLTNGATAATIALGTNSTLVTSLDFNPSTEQFAQFSHTAPDSMDSATALECKFQWSHPATTTNFGVAWAVRAKFVRDDDGIDGAWSSWVQVNDTGGTTDDKYTSGAASVTPAGTYASGCKIYWEIKRVAGDATNDTLAVVARLDEFSFKYTTNALNDN